MVRQAGKQDIAAAGELAALLWPGHSVEEMAASLAGLLSNGEARVFLAFEGDKAVGFAQCQLRRDYVEGTHTSPVGYLEGIFVREEFRSRGLARALLAACEDWARAMGCTEFASDCELDNRDSLRFHMALNFTEANRIICFTKKL